MNPDLDTERIRSEIIRQLALLIEKEGPKEAVCFFNETINKIRNNTLQPTNNISPNQQNQKLTKVYEYVDKNYDKSFTIQMISRHVGLSETSFCRFFKQWTQSRFVDYLNTVRIEKAARLLTETNEPITSVGYSCGFNTINYFIHLFKKEKGITPATFRKQLLRN